MDNREGSSSPEIELFSPEELEKLGINPESPIQLNDRALPSDPLKRREVCSMVMLDCTQASLHTRSEIIKTLPTNSPLRQFPIRINGGSTQGVYTPKGQGYDTIVRPNFKEGAYEFNQASSDLNFATIYNRYYQESILTIQRNIQDTTSRITPLIDEMNRISAQIDPIIQQLETINNGLNILYGEYQGNYSAFNSLLRDGLSSNQIIWSNGRYQTTNPIFTNVTNIQNNTLEYIQRNQSEYERIHSQLSPLFNQRYPIERAIMMHQNSLDMHQSELEYYERRSEMLNELLPGYRQNYDQAFRERFSKSYNLESKIPELQKSFSDLTNKTYSREEIRKHYTNAANIYGGFLEGIQNGSIAPEKIKETIGQYASLLTLEEKIILGNLFNQQSYAHSYDREKLLRGKFPAISSFEDKVVNLANASLNNRLSPLSLCTGISGSGAELMQLLGIKAAVATVGQSPTGHAVTYMEVGGKYIINDQGKNYISNTIQGVLDTYALINESLVFANYITDKDGKVIGQIRTPLNEKFREALFSKRNFGAWIENPSLMEDGAEIELTTQSKGITLTNKTPSGWYLQAGYTEREIATIKLQTTKASIGFEGGETLRHYAEVTVSDTTSTFASGNTSKDRGIEISSGLSGKAYSSDALDVTIGSGISAKYQGKIGSNDVDGIPYPIWKRGVGIPQSAEVSGGVSAGVRYKPSPDLTLSGGLSHGKYVVPNVQSISDKSNWGTVGKTTLSGGGEYNTGNGKILGGGSYTRNGIENTSRTYLGFQNDGTNYTLSRELRNPHDSLFGSPVSIVTAGISGKFQYTEQSKGTWYVHATRQRGNGGPNSLGVGVNIPFH